MERESGLLEWLDERGAAVERMIREYDAATVRSLKDSR